MFDIAPRFDAQSLKPTALQLLELLAFMSTGVPEHIIKELALHLLFTDSLYDVVYYIEARDALLEQPLIVLEGPKQKLVIIDTIQNQVFATLNDDKRERFFAGVACKIWTQWPAALPKPSKRPQQFPDSKPRAQRLLMGPRPECEYLQHTIARLEKLYPAILELLHGATRLLFTKLAIEGAWFKIERGYLSETLPTLFTAAQVLRQIDHADKDAVLADLHFCFGVVAMESNDFAASRTHKDKSFAIVSRICEDLGVEDERLSVAYSERGIAHIQDGRLDEGIADIAASIRIMEVLDDEYVPASREANMAWALMAQGKLEDADALLEESLQARYAELGEDEQEIAGTGLLLSATAALRSRLYHEEESCKCHERAFMSNEAMTAWSVDVLANKNEEARTIYLKSRAFAAMGKSETARRLRNQSIALYNEVTKEDKNVDTICAADFDRLVPFWSR
ncbi:hypothetical protein LLEC1_03858 [Akanthomyces lecanii]|uniref:MalT-like TPR region domain-containing protein n=1 Tax=Cordyceps confragosa TaxID=2714763 RepID=A0A179II61_CORDF|nr:hypothetical protein LLEC1_03858 [Akanthomyces lecanii]